MSYIRPGGRAGSRVTGTGIHSGSVCLPLPRLSVSLQVRPLPCREAMGSGLCEPPALLPDGAQSGCNETEATPRPGSPVRPKQTRPLALTECPGTCQQSPATSVDLCGALEPGARTRTKSTATGTPPRSSVMYSGDRSLKGGLTGAGGGGNSAALRQNHHE